MAVTRFYIAICCFAALAAGCGAEMRSLLQSNPEGGSVVASRLVSKLDPTLCVKSSQATGDDSDITLSLFRCGSNDPGQLWRIDLVDFAGIQLDYQPGKRPLCFSYREGDPGGVVTLSSIYCELYQPAQEWQFTPEGRISPVDEPEWCLDLYPDVVFPVSGATVYVSLCDPLRPTQEFVVAPRVASDDGVNYKDEAFRNPVFTPWVTGAEASLPDAETLYLQDTTTMTEEELALAGVMSTPRDRNDVILSAQCSGSLCGSTRYEQGTGNFLVKDSPQRLSWLDANSGPRTCPEGSFVSRVSTQGAQGSRIQLECKDLRDEYQWCTDGGQWTEWLTSSPGTTSDVSCQPQGSNSLLATSDFVAGMDCKDLNCTFVRLWCQKICAANSLVPASKTLKVTALTWVYVNGVPDTTSTIQWQISKPDQLAIAIKDINNRPRNWRFSKSAVAVAGSLFRGDSFLGASQQYVSSVEDELDKEVIDYLRGSQGATSSVAIKNICFGPTPHMWVAFHDVKGRYPSQWETRVPVLEKTMCTANYVQPSCPFGTCKDEDEEASGSSQTNCRQCCVAASLNVEECGARRSSGGYIDVATLDICFPGSPCEEIGGASTARGLLLQFKDTHDLTGSLDWDPETEMCSDWEGVSCNTPELDSGLRLALPAKDLSGSLPRVWSVLPAIDLLVLTDNRLTGPLPTEWEKLTNLNILDLRFNCLDLTNGVPTGFPANAFLDQQGKCDMEIEDSAVLVSSGNDLATTSAAKHLGISAITAVTMLALSALGYCLY